jgi:hypothetical protein
MKNNGKTIQIFLPDGNPKGIKKAEIRTDKIEVILSSKKDFLENKNIFDFTGVYILVDSLQEREPELYIGKGRVKDRLTSHDNNKDFWNSVFAIRLKTEEGFNESHTSYLEHYFIKKAKNLKQSTIVENKQTPKEPKLEESIVCELADYIETIEILISTLGLKAFQPITESKAKNNIFICKSNDGCYAEGEYTQDGLVVFKGAKMAKELKGFFKNKRIQPGIRPKLIENKTLTIDGDFYVLQENYCFSSPTTSAQVILGQHTNGWVTWKRKSDNKTLDEVYRNKE